jgi:hypothetical protein
VKTIQQTIAAAVEYCDKEACGDSGLSFRPSYSGRGMYGKDCVGVVGGKAEIMELIAYIIQEAHAAHVSAVVATAQIEDTLQYAAKRGAAEEVEREASDFAARAVDTLLNFSQDSMGRSDVIIYWEELSSKE